MANNIDTLLQRLPQGSLAYQLVSLMGGQPRNKWQETLTSLLQCRVDQQIQRYRHAPDQTPAD